MSFETSAALAFARPGGERCVPSKARPVDLVHLARQTFGDRALEQEILALFMSQLVGLRDRIAKANPAERTTLAHTLKGSSRSVGAFAIGDCAEAIEREPSSKSHVRRLGELVEDVREFLAAINR